MSSQTPPPILIIGAGISGLLLAQHLTLLNTPFLIFERRSNLATTNVGWGLTISWSLATLRNLLPPHLRERLVEAYVDRVAVEKGEVGRFPFYELGSGELKAETPVVGEDRRIRVGRERFRELLARGVTVEYNKSFSYYEEDNDDGSITVFFDDGTHCVGSLLIGCDGVHSRVRRQLLPSAPRDNYRIPIGVMGAKIEVTAEEIEPLRRLDPFFLQGASQKNDTFLYFSVLDAPGNEGTQNFYTAQIVASWPFREGFFGRDAPIGMPASNDARRELLNAFAETWAEPFRGFVLGLPEMVELKPLELSDWVPPRGVHGRGRVVLAGDAFHPMAMYRGDGANHSIQDVQGVVQTVLPALLGAMSNTGLRAAIDEYEDEVVARCRPAVLASRRAALDAHEYGRINAKSPLLSPRVMHIEFDEQEDM